MARFPPFSHRQGTGMTRAQAEDGATMEKRRRQRKKTHLPTRFGADRPERLGLITDVSDRGVYLSTNIVLAAGSPVQLQVRVPGGDDLQLAGKVMRARRVASALVTIATGGMGIRLENPPADWRVRLSLPEEGG
jgi:hypothetical protein